MTTSRGAILVSCLFAILLLCGCADDPVSSSADEPEDISATPRADSEAEEMALYISRQLVAPEALYQRVKTDLHEIRTLFADSGSLADIRFFMYTFPSRVTLTFRPSFLSDSTTAGFRQFDSLNTFLRLQSVSRYRGWHSLSFDGLLHPFRLVDAYLTIDGIESAHVDVPVGGRSSIYPVQYGRTIRYFISAEGGDCPAGCGYAFVHCVDARGDQYTYVGNYNTWSEDEPPEWWSGYINAWEDFHRNRDDD